MLTYQTESFAHVCDEARELAQANWDAAAAGAYGMQVYSLDTVQYMALESLGMLHISTVRNRDGKLVGYASFAIAKCYHRSGALVATLDALYLCPHAKKDGMESLRLLKHAQKELVKLDVKGVQYASLVSRPCDALYRRLGAHMTETLWYKELV